MNLSLILPLIILAAASIIIMLLIAVKRNYNLSFGLNLFGLAAAFISLFYISGKLPQDISNFLIVDNYSLFFIGLLIAASFTISLLSHSSLKNYKGNREEYYILLIIATLGSSVLVCSYNFISFFLGLEILSVSLYILIAYTRESSKSLEAGIKYLILAAASSAFLLFGMALLYAEYGTMNFPGISMGLKSIGITPLVLTGFGMMIVGIGFKLAVVPFHMWTPDVYEGASAPVTAFIATVSKGGMFALLLRFFFIVNGYHYHSIILIFTVISIASMIGGNLLALLQRNVKRILAYSSIAHLGYLLVAFISGNKLTVEAVTFYLVAYFITIIGAFGIVTILSADGKEAENIDDYKGLFWKRPLIAATFTAMMLSLAGIPLTAGFIGKYLLLAAGIGSTLWLLSIVLVLSSVIGLYYYLRIITAMYSKKEDGEEKRSLVFSLGGSIALAFLTLFLVWLGVFPSGLMAMIRKFVGHFFNG
jgi:NADH-quinone oxidoreductase subunit N